FEGPKGTTTVRASDHALIQEMYQAKLVADGDMYVPELIAAVPADEVAPAEAEEDPAPMSTSVPPALAVHDLGLQIGGATILEGVGLAVAPGSMVGVIGPNGAGKTTLFNVISGVLRPTAGRVELGGADITGLSIPRRTRAGLGRTFQT